MRTLFLASVLAITSAACSPGPIEAHPACAEVDRGVSLTTTASIPVTADGANQVARDCVVTLLPGVKAGFDTELGLSCRIAPSTQLTMTVKVPDFRGAAAGSTIASRAIALAAYGWIASGSTQDLSKVVVEERAGSLQGDDVSPDYVLRGTIVLRIAKATMKRTTTDVDPVTKQRTTTVHQVEVAPIAIDVPFTWSREAFEEENSRCPQ